MNIAGDLNNTQPVKKMAFIHNLDFDSWVAQKQETITKQKEREK